METTDGQHDGINGSGGVELEEQHSGDSVSDGECSCGSQALDIRLSQGGQVKEDGWLTCLVC